jgi:hypothetical protein
VPQDAKALPRVMSPAGQWRARAIVGASGAAGIFRHAAEASLPLRVPRRFLAPRAKAAIAKMRRRKSP